VNDISTATIISDDPDFRSRYAEQFQALRFKVKTSEVLDNWELSSQRLSADCYIVDNSAGNFPFKNFTTHLFHTQAVGFLLNIGKLPPRTLRGRYLIFTVEPGQTGIPLDLFIQNSERLLKNYKTQLDLANMLIHDTRSPLNSLVGYLELLLNETFGVLNEGQKNILEKTMDLGDETLDMLEDLGEIFQASPRRILTQKQPFDFMQVLDAVLVHTWIKADKKDIVIKKDVHSDLKKLDGDDYQIQRVLTNLCNNAIKYCPEHSQITVQARAAGEECAEIAVIDNGGGVPEKQLPHLFDKYFRVREKKTPTKGYGLGLYICKIIVRAHKGKIWAENNSAGGLTVKFTIPFAKG